MISRKITSTLLIGLLALQTVPCLALTTSKKRRVTTQEAEFTPAAAQAMVEDIRERMIVAQQNGDTQEVARLLEELEYIIARARKASAASLPAASRKKGTKNGVAPIISSYNHDDKVSWSNVIASGIAIAFLIGISVPMIVMAWKMMFEILDISIDRAS